MKKTICIILSCLLMVQLFAFNSAASADFYSSQNGFSFDESKYDITWYSSCNKIYVYAQNKYLVGIGYQQVGVARQKTNMKKQYILVRFILSPQDTKSGSKYYHGINKKGVITIGLGTGQKYNDHSPDSTLVTTSNTCSFSLGGSINSKGDYSGSLTIGASTSWQTNCYDIISKIDGSMKSIKTIYTYNPSKNIISTDGRKKINRWCNGEHKEYAMVSLENNSTTLPTFTVGYDYNMWYAYDLKLAWGGSTWDVVYNDSCSSSLNINYVH